MQVDILVAGKTHGRVGARVTSGSADFSALTPAPNSDFGAGPQLQDFPGSTSDKEPACQFRRHRRPRFNPWVGKIPWWRKWQPTPVFLPRESHGQKSLAGYSPWGHKESDTTEEAEHTHWPPDPAPPCSTVGPEAPLTFLGLCFHVCKMGTVISLPLKVTVKIRDDLQRTFSLLPDRSDLLWSWYWSSCHFYKMATKKKKKKKWFGLFLSKYLTDVGAQLDSGRHEISRKLSFPFLFLSDIVSFFQTTVLKVLSLSKKLTKPDHMLSHGAVCVVTI